jgi:regulator of sigma E protease
MNTAISNNSIKKLLYAIAGLAGISLIILVHELGHFLFAQLFNVPTPTFSLGFGPTLLEYPIGNTIFKLALFPFGGYVEMDPELLAQQKYIPQMLILFGGILFNIIFSYSILLYYTIRNKLSSNSTSNTSESIKETFTTFFIQQNGKDTILGPIGVIAMIGQSIAINTQLYWFALAIISFNIALLNMIPLPFFDGGKALILTIETLIGTTIPATIIYFISTVFLTIFLLFITQVTMNDIKRLVKK